MTKTTPEADKDRLDRREALLRSATKLFSSKGYHLTSVQEISAAAGVATGTFYLYFPSKDAVFHAMIQKLYEQVVESVLEARAGCADEPVAKLMHSLEAALKVFASEPELARVILLQAGGARPSFTEELSAIHRTLSILIESDLEEGIELGHIPPQHVVVSARAFVGAAYELVMGWLLDGIPSDLEAAFPDLSLFVLRGIGAEKKHGLGGVAHDRPNLE